MKTRFIGLITGN